MGQFGTDIVRLDARKRGGTWRLHKGSLPGFAAEQRKGSTGLNIRARSLAVASWGDRQYGI